MSNARNVLLLLVFSLLLPGWQQSANAQCNLNGNWELSLPEAGTVWGFAAAFGTFGAESVVTQNNELGTWQGLNLGSLLLGGMTIYGIQNIDSGLALGVVSSDCRMTGIFLGRRLTLFSGHKR